MTHSQIINIDSDKFNIGCKQCDRLVTFLTTVKKKHPDYYCRPVPPFGDPNAKLLLIGLAPGKHGANASGRPFTGDHAGILLYKTLHTFGLASQPIGAKIDDGLMLNNIRIINAVKCLPPENKPTTVEIDACNAYLKAELNDPKVKAVIALGTIAHRAILKAQGLVIAKYTFGHMQQHTLPNGVQLIDSYHCSRYNTQTKRLTEKMFAQVFELAVSL